MLRVCLQLGASAALRHFVCVSSTHFLLTSICGGMQRLAANLHMKLSQRQAFKGLELGWGFGVGDSGELGTRHSIAFHLV